MTLHPVFNALKKYLIALSILLLAVLVAQHKQPYLDRTSVFMVYMLAVVVVAFLLGRGPAFLACLLSVFLFIYIHYNTIYRPQVFQVDRVGYAYLFTLGVMLLTAGIISSLAGRLRQKARESVEREARTAALYALSAELADRQSEAEVMASTRMHLAQAFQAEVEAVPAPPPPWPGRAPDVAGAVGVEALLAEPAGAEVTILAPLTVEGQTAFLLRLTVASPRVAAREQWEHLAAMVKQCTQALERIALRRRLQQNTVLIQKESLRNSILSTLSHDLRTPLASIIGASSSLLTRSEDFPADAERRLQTVIHDEAQHMLHLVKNLLDMAKLQGGDLQIAQDWEALEEMIGSAVAELRRRVTSHDIVVQVPRDLPFIRCDSVLIERVIINLLENAVKYSPPGTQVTLAARALDGAIEVTVADAGEGIPEALREKVFEPFYRLHPGLAGGGIGLTICRSIVEAHGGRIRLAEAAGGGLAVHFTLPTSADTPSLGRESAATTLEN